MADSAPKSQRPIFEMHPFSEAEMWLDTLANFFKHNTLPFVSPKKVVSLDKNFCDELRLTSHVLNQIERLVGQLVLQQARKNATGAEDPDQVEAAIQAGNFAQIKSGSMLVNRLVLFLESLGDVKAIVQEMVRHKSAPYPVFKSVGRLLNKEFVALKRSRFFLRLRSVHSDKHFQRVIYGDILALVDNQQMRLEVAGLLMLFFRLMAYLHFVADSLKKNYNFRVLLLVFSLLYWEIQILVKRLEASLSDWQRRGQNVHSQFQLALYAVRIESKRVFERELADIDEVSQIEAIYAKLEDGCHLLRNCLQNSIINLSRALNPSFNEYGLFTDILNRYEETICLSADLQTLLEFVTLCERDTCDENVGKLSQILGVFCETSLRYLMFKDWNTFEAFVDEISTYRDARSLQFTLHKFAVFLDTLIGMVNKRAVLSMIESA